MITEISAIAKRTIRKPKNKHSVVVFIVTLPVGVSAFHLQKICKTTLSALSHIRGTTTKRRSTKLFLFATSKCFRTNLILLGRVTLFHFYFGGSDRFVQFHGHPHGGFRIAGQHTAEERLCQEHGHRRHTYFARLQQNDYTKDL